MFLVITSNVSDFFLFFKNKIMKQYISILCGLLLPLTIFSQHTISGQVVLPNAVAVCDVLVTLSDADGQILDQEVTPSDGVFSFVNLTDGEDYTVSFSKGGNHANGVSTFDLVWISRHILGVQTFDQQYDYWAADVNNSEVVTTLDMIQSRRLILAINTEFSNNTAWRFVEADAAFPDAGSFGVTNLNEDINFDVIGIKVGDVNESAVVCE